MIVEGGILVILVWFLYLIDKERKNNGKPGIPVVGFIFENLSINVTETVEKSVMDTPNGVDDGKKKKKRKTKKDSKRHKKSSKPKKKTKRKSKSSLKSKEAADVPGKAGVSVTDEDKLSEEPSSDGSGTESGKPGAKSAEKPKTPEAEAISNRLAAEDKLIRDPTDTSVENKEAPGNKDVDLSIEKKN